MTSNCTWDGIKPLNIIQEVLTTVILVSNCSFLSVLIGQARIQALVPMLPFPVLGYTLPPAILPPPPSREATPDQSPNVPM